MSVRISAHDWAPGGNTPDDAVEIARSVQGSRRGHDRRFVRPDHAPARPVYGRMYQTPFSDRIRNEVGIATIAVGNIFEADHVNSIIAAGRADLVRSRVRTSPIRSGRCTQPRSWAYHDVEWPKPVSDRQSAARAQPGARRADGDQCVTRALNGKARGSDRRRARHWCGHRRCAGGAGCDPHADGARPRAPGGSSAASRGTCGAGGRRGCGIGEGRVLPRNCSCGTRAHPDQQRRRCRECAVRAHRPRAVDADAGCQSHRHLPLLSRGDGGHARAWRMGGS